MFTGIIQQTCALAALEPCTDLHRFAVEIPRELCAELETGASIAVDGCCQTVTQIEATSRDSNLVWFDAMQETLRVTTLGSLQIGQLVNIERAARFGQEIGGHELSGHIDDVATVVEVTSSENNHVIKLHLPSTLTAYVFNKGYLGVHGASLTVSDMDKEAGTFCIYLIPETLRLTNLGSFKTGDVLNIEIDRRTQIVVETVNSYLRESGVMATGDL